jgi:hypothetical protein
MLGYFIITAMIVIAVSFSVYLKWGHPPGDMFGD